VRLPMMKRVGGTTGKVGETLAFGSIGRKGLGVGLGGIAIPTLKAARPSAYRRRRRDLLESGRGCDPRACRWQKRLQGLSR